MSDEYFYHYTNYDGAKAIFLSGKILPSLAANGNAVPGDGVYLTTLDPRLGRDTVQKNNWAGLARHKDYKMECYFEILLPSRKVKRAKEKRDIQVYTGELCLGEFKWSLKNWDGDILATQHFMISSEGEAAKQLSYTMGRYTLCRNIVTNEEHPVYKHEEGEVYLYTIKNGNWCVGPVAGNDVCYLLQKSNNSPSPHKTIVWQYASCTGDWPVDQTLKVYPCY